MNNNFIIILDRATDNDRTAVHAIVKQNAKGWWHRFVNVWIVGGLSAVEWRELVAPAVASPGSVLVIRFPDNPPGRWSANAPDAKERFEWLHKNL